MSFTIRSPAINLRLYALQKTLSKGTGEHEDAAVIRKEIRRLNAILEDFLQLHGRAGTQLRPNVCRKRASGKSAIFSASSLRKMRSN